jgi:peptidoglycan/xylan/chitin deacetylase (PgdA/CDA1 family)
MDLTGLGLGMHRVGSDTERLRTAADLIGRLKYQPNGQRSELAQAIAEAGNCSVPDDLMMTDAQVRELVRGGMSIGAHTMTHPILACVEPRVAEQEIADSRAALEALIRDKVRLFAYPNGKPSKDYTGAHVDMVRRAGFSGAVSTAMGAASQGADLLQVPRFTPWRWDALGFRLQLLQNLLRNRYPLAVAH